MQCVILAGGLATRMKPITETIPKSLIEVADGRPFVSDQLAYLRSQGIKHVVFCIGHLGTMIQDFVGDGRTWGLKVTYSDEGPQLMGTGGALLLAHSRGLVAERFLVMYGDSFLPIEFEGVWKSHVASGLPATMTILENANRWDTSNVRFVRGDSKVRLYDKHLSPKPADMTYIDYGLSVLNREVLEKYLEPGRKQDLAEVFNRLSLDGKLGAYVVDQRFYEIGSMAGLAEYRAYVSSAASPPGPLTG